MKRVCSRCGRSTVVYYKDRKARVRLANKEDFILLLARRERIDNHRTDVECPLLSTLSPFSVVLIEGETETVAEQPGLFEDGEGGAR